MVTIHTIIIIVFPIQFAAILNIIIIVVVIQRLAVKIVIIVVVHIILHSVIGIEQWIRVTHDFLLFN
ncbi:MAG: hypothetical protein EBR82_49805 [Caulobacteraceae bacterium]|nr:hypothetical protein [Caulobacteraceae bacterium]